VDAWGSVGHGRTATVVVSRERLAAKKKRDGRSMYDEVAKRQLIEACLVPGVSIAGMALAQGVNANVLRKWLTRERKIRREQSAQTAHSTYEPTHRAKTSATSTLAKLLPVSISKSETSTHTAPVAAMQPRAASARLAIEIGGARVLVESESIDREALSSGRLVFGAITSGRRTSTGVGVVG
jgi:transposase